MFLWLASWHVIMRADVGNMRFGACWWLETVIKFLSISQIDVFLVFCIECKNSEKSKFVAKMLFNVKNIYYFCTRKIVKNIKLTQ